MIFRKIQSLVLVLASFTLIAGCATTSSTRQADLDDLNAKIAAMQSQLAEKDNQMARLSNQMKDEELARRQAESEQRSLSDKLANALSQLESKKTVTARPDSDLK
jgi:chromosome segregation ATPase